VNEAIAVIVLCVIVCIAVAANEAAKKKLIQKLSTAGFSPEVTQFVRVRYARAILGYSRSAGILRLVGSTDDFKVDFTSSNVAHVDLYKDESRSNAGATTYSNVHLIVTCTAGDSPTEKLYFSSLADAQTWFGYFQSLMREGQAALAGKGVSGQLTELHNLFQAGGLSEDEWDQAKVRFLGRPQAQVDAVADALTKLHSLKQAGVLSMSEFNSKKWDLLSKPQS